MSTLEPITRIEQFLADIIEQGGSGGGSGGGVLVNATADQNGNLVLDKTAGELWADLLTGASVVVKIVDTEDPNHPATLLLRMNGTFGSGEYIFDAQYYRFTASSEADFPASGGGD